MRANMDMWRWVLTFFMFFPYALAFGGGLLLRVADYAVAALQVGFDEGLHGRSRDKPKE